MNGQVAMHGKYIKPPILITSHQAKYFAYDLTGRNTADGVGRLSQSLFNASVDLNPHQIEAALFATKGNQRGQRHLICSGFENN